MAGKLVFIFIDGIGLGKDSQSNPFCVAEMPFIRGLTGCPLVEGVSVNNGTLLFKGIDACLGVDGIPQGATGQTSLFTGINASKHLGYYFLKELDQFLQGIVENIEPETTILLTSDHT